MWLRWRLLVGSVRGSHRRDTMEQVSRIFAAVIPLTFVALSLGSVLAVCMLGFLAGRSIVTGLIEPAVIVMIIRLSMIVMLGLVVIITLASPVQSSVVRYNRLLLLPISRQTLHVIEVLANLADPWLGFMIPGLVCFSLGLSLGGRYDSAAIALVASVGMMAVLASLAALVGFLVSWLFRSRRRGELFTLIFVLSLSLLAFLPATFSKNLEARKQARTGGQAPVEDFVAAKFDATLPVWSRAVPSELYGRAILAGVERRYAAAGWNILALVGEAALLFGASSLIHARLLTALGQDRRRRRGTAARTIAARLPFVNGAVSAIAITQFRTALRSVRGRLIVLLPGPLIALMTLLFRTMPQDDYRWATVLSREGHLVLAAGAVFAIYAMQAFTMNLFGSDRHGLTLHFLSPVDDADLALGKVVGSLLTLCMAVLICFAAALAVAPTGSPYYWLATFAGSFATFLILSPIAIWFSALFPVASDLSKTGSGGNPHPLPMLAGTVLTLVAAAPPGLILAADELWIHRPRAALLLMLVWTFMSAAIAMPLVGLAAKTIGFRRENLNLVATGR
jgi:hypothetical protein